MQRSAQLRSLFALNTFGLSSSLKYSHFSKMTNAHMVLRGFSSQLKRTQVPEAKTELQSAETPVHFKASATQHPLGAPKLAVGDHTGLQQNWIWKPEEINEKMACLYHHRPKSLGDHLMHKFMYGLYYTFNFVTGYRQVNPSPRAIEWRLITLESVAGVPGFVAAGLRHFKSLRTLRRDYGWIPSLLEEAENERMHLLVCLKAFQAPLSTRVLVYTAQMVMIPLLMGIYLIHPKSMHRLVGYLEETAVRTYINVIKHIETPGTLLNAAWADKPAPGNAIGYWRLPPQAKWIDALKCMMADECNHRDVNHTLADMKSDDPNPFLETYKAHAASAWRHHLAGEPVKDVSKSPKT